MIPSLTSLVISEIYKKSLDVKFYQLVIGRKYYIVEKNGLATDVGRLVEYKNNSEIERICWYDGPIYVHQKQHFVFENADRELSAKLDSIEMHDFYKEYVGFFEY